MTGGAWTFGDLIVLALDRATADARALEDECLEALKTSGATVYVNGLRLARVQNVCMIVGAFGILEAEVSSLRAYRCSKKPLQDLVAALERGGRCCLAQRLRILTRAVNVLKHGRGPSHEWLMNLKEKPAFLRVKVSPKEFFNEGDVSEVPTLVDADSEFVAAAASTLREVVEVIE